MVWSIGKKKPNYCHLQFMERSTMGKEEDKLEKVALLYLGGSSPFLFKKALFFVMDTHSSFDTQPFTCSHAPFHLLSPYPFSFMPSLSLSFPLFT